MTDSSEPIHPGKILYEMAMEPLGVSRNKLARDIDVPVGRISDIVAGKRGITPDTALRLGKYFGTSAEMWMQFQTDHDLHVARQTVWLEIAPRVRELEPGEVGAVAPVTAMDNHPEAADDYVLKIASEPEDASEWNDEAGRDESHARSEAHDDVEEKWWSAPLSETHSDPGPAEDTVVASEEPRTRETLAPDVEPAATTAQPIAAAPAAGTDDDEPVHEQTFEIDVRPSAAENRASGVVDRSAEPEAPRRRFTVEVVREAPEPGAETVAEPAAEAFDAVEDGAIDDEEFALDLKGGDPVGGAPEDAFESEFDGDLDSEFEDAFESEPEERVEREQFVQAVARTGTDDFAPLDPSVAAPGHDAGAATSVSQPAARAPTPAGTEIGGLSPANWSNALRSEFAAEGGPVASAALRDRPSAGAAATESEPASSADDVLAVPLPSEVEPALEGPVPPWPPADQDDMAASLDIPDPEDVRKLYEYDD